MTIHFKLDTAAVMSLFPEGSEARLQLQQSVINEVVKNIVDRSIASLKIQIDIEVRRHIDRILGEAGFYRNPSNIQLSDNARLAIAACTKDLIDTEIRNVVAAHKHSAMANIEQKLNVALDDGLRVRLNQTARESLRQALTSLEFKL